MFIKKTEKCLSGKFSSSCLIFFNIETANLNAKNVNNPNYSKSSKIYSNVDNEWEKIPGRFELAKSEIFLKRNECVIDNLII